MWTIHKLVNVVMKRYVSSNLGVGRNIPSFSSGFDFPDFETLSKQPMKDDYKPRLAKEEGTVVGLKKARPQEMVNIRISTVSHPGRKTKRSS